MRKPIIAGNWKLNKTIDASIELVTLLKRELSDVDEVDIVVCPVFTSLSAINDVILESNIDMGAQNLYWEDSGAFTGEVSAPLIKDAGCKYVIIGHSERRQFFGETNQTVNKKIKAALASGLLPIVCVGEVLEERETGKTFDVVKTQVTQSLAGFTPDELSKLIIAYEPVWAIGTGKTATPQQAQEVHKFIRGIIAEIGNDEIAAALRIQYGGSVKPDNIKELMSQEDIDGALVGGASLKPDSFIALVKGAL
ncbi:MAG: triose-phosphate isomerase [Omnitrophica WOR_2 bacterium GWF2_38_59]|nr:MAG: triose-phosphate isomerase [Omnitrophica WOR_2 bacterium GWF2_38_59]OGX53963.1 MAG: triose-phosphate isomerase [Omnitrophica WOR_2 bacterium RIFOXYA12_FULL_38_10]OGX59531.1 MAG: triose-phosphate isomerase [Omnitrophica WOR_2 bacterium RIFOXYC2_FULL_38_12]HBG61536.1 triose-phosphate isomerase [Candidatus Omnitrophota bacterium]